MATFLFDSVSWSPQSGICWALVEFCSNRVMINEFACRPGIISVSYNTIQWNLPSCFWYLMTISTFCPSEGSTVYYGHWSSWIKYVYNVFYVVTICDVAPESAINISLSSFWLEHFAINRLSYVISYKKFFAASFLEFFLFWPYFSSWLIILKWFLFFHHFLCSCW